VLAFRGIPYAQSPVGPLRFRPPHKPVAWDGVRDACTYGPAPMQVGNALSAQLGQVPPEVHEDCLYLNVWTPAAVALVHQGAGEPGAARAGFGDEAERLPLGLQLSQQLIKITWPGPDSPAGDDFGTRCLGHRGDRPGGFLDIHAHGERARRCHG
jgi:hypothetical protein